MQFNSTNDVVRYLKSQPEDKKFLYLKSVSDEILKSDPHLTAEQKNTHIKNGTAPVKGPIRVTKIEPSNGPSSYYVITLRNN